METDCIIIMHDDVIKCGRKKCKGAVLITPVNLDGEWSCPVCNKYRKVANIDKELLEKGIKWTG